MRGLFVWAAVAALAATIVAGADLRVTQPFKDTDGKTVKASAYRGKVVVMNFWATWCVPCRGEMPMLVQAEKEWAPRGVVFVAVSLDDKQSRPKIPAFVEEFGIHFPVWTGASTMDLQDLKLGEALPATAFLDREGRIAARVLGQVPKEELYERLDWLTGDGKGPGPEVVVRHVGGK